VACVSYPPEIPEIIIKIKFRYSLELESMSIVCLNAIRFVEGFERLNQQSDFIVS
jgi:hypothetical protein